jgi:hypothetical protein
VVKAAKMSAKGVGPTVENANTLKSPTADLLPENLAPATESGVSLQQSTAGAGGTAEIIVADDAFVRIDATCWDESILKLGIQKRFFADKTRVWLTKFKDVNEVLEPTAFETILYRQNLWPEKLGIFKDGVTIRMVNNVDDAVAAGITNMKNGVPQWRITRDIPPEDLILIKRLKGKQ